MNSYTTYQNQLKSLVQTSKTNDVAKTAFKDADWLSLIREIGVKNNLNLVQLGVLYDLTNQIILGQLGADGFKERLVKIWKEEDWNDYDDKTIDGIIKDLNNAIFLPLREVMKKSSDQPEPSDENLDREDVLAGIENPTPSQYRAPSPQATPKLQEAKEAPRSSAPVRAPEPPPLPPPAKSLEIPAGANILEAKMAGAVKMPVVESKIPPQTSVPSAPAQKKYDVDPYREPAN